MTLRFAFNTNGCANHRLGDALSLIADSGYDGVALTLDHHHLDPFAPDFEARAERFRQQLVDLGLGLVIETGARYLLDPRRKHEPTLLSPDADGRAQRIDFLCRAIRLCAICDGEAVSFWAGVPRHDVDREQAWRCLVDGVARVADEAAARNVCLAFEPEPGMLVETVDDFVRLKAAVARRTDAPLTLALDTGHCMVTGEREPADAVREFRSHLGTVTLEDMRRGVHEHLPFGEGEMDVPAVLTALSGIGFQKLVCIELSRESHRAHAMIPQAIAWLRERLPAAA